MKTRAAISRGTGLDWEVVELELDPPKVGEVLVRFVAESAIGPTGPEPSRVSLNIAVFELPSVTDSMPNVLPLLPLE